MTIEDNIAFIESERRLPGFVQAHRLLRIFAASKRTAPNLNRAGLSRMTRKDTADRAEHAAWAAEAIAVFQQYCPTDDQHAIADLICDLGHLAEERFDFVSEVRRGIRHWFAECHAVDSNRLGPDAVV